LAECGKNNRVAYVQVAERGMMGPSDPLPKAGARFSSKPAALAGTHSFNAVVLDGKVWVGTMCVICRLPSSEYAIAALADATDEQLIKVQAQVGLPKAPVLRTEAAWIKALESVGART